MPSGPVLPHWQEAEPGVAERLKPRTFLNHITEIYKSEENSHFSKVIWLQLVPFLMICHVYHQNNTDMMQHKTHKNHADVIEKLCFLPSPLQSNLVTFMHFHTVQKPIF